MSKKQTRRSISLSENLYDRLVARRDETGEPISAFVERLIRAELDVQDKAPETPSAARERRRAARDARTEMAKAAAAEPEVVRENRVMSNPCRLETCSRRGLHANHDDDPGKYNVRHFRSREERALDEADPYVDHFS